jgi:hypothetical protein
MVAQSEHVLALNSCCLAGQLESEGSRPAGLIGLVDSVDAAKDWAPMFVVGLLRDCCPALWTPSAHVLIFAAAAAAAAEKACDDLSA